METKPAPAVVLDDKFDEEAAKQWEQLLSMGAAQALPLKSPYIKKQPLILTLRDGLRVGNQTFGTPVAKHYGEEVKAIEVMFECIGPMADDCSVLVLASEDGYDKPKHRIICKLSDLRPYPPAMTTKIMDNYVPRPRDLNDESNKPL